MKLGPFNISWNRSNKKNYSNYTTGNKYQYTTGISSSNFNHPIVTILEDCTSGKIGANPRERLYAYRAMDEVIPVLADARDWLRFSVGRLELTSEDPRLEQELQEWAKMFEIRPDRKMDFVFERGLNNYVHSLLDGAERDGMAFGELYSDGRREPVKGVMTRDAECFYFRTQGDLDLTTELIYNSVRGPVVVTESSNFIAYSAKRDTRFAWGLPMGYGTEWLHEKLLKRFNAWEGGNIRAGYPPTVHVLSPDMEDAMGNPVLLEQIKGEIKPDGTRQDPIQKQMTEAWEGGISDVYKRGKSFDLWAMFRGKMKYEQHVHGKGIPLSTMFPEEHQLLCSDIARRGPVPLGLLNLSREAGGIGSNKFRTEAAMLVSAAEHYRDRLEVVVKKIVSAYLVSLGAGESTLTNWKPVWVAPSIEDFKEKAEAKLREAEAVGKEWETFTNMVLEGAREGANAYARELGREEWDTGNAT